MTTCTRNQYNVAKITCLAIMALVLLGVQTGASVAMAQDLIPGLFWNRTNVPLLSDSVFTIPEKSRPLTIKTIHLDSTAYTSRIQERDGLPFITADGSVVRDGYVATNVLPIGTKIRLPTIFGDKIFEVHDRTSSRYSNRVDIWMKDLQTAKRHGVKRNIVVEVVEMGNGKRNWDQWKGRTADLHRIGKYGPAEEPIEQS